MADKLSIYNTALQLLGERRLATLGEEGKTRFELDAAWNAGAPDYCLEAVKPTFARQLVELRDPDPVTGKGSFNFHHDFPADWLSTFSAYTDPTLTHPLERFVQDGSGILTETNAVVFLRYVSDAVADTPEVWDLSFVELVAAYLARQIAITIRPERFEVVDALFKERYEALLMITEENDKTFLTHQQVGNLSSDWLAVYNDALLLLGVGPQQLLVSTDTTSQFRVLLDAAVTAGLVPELLEDTGWFWAQSSTRTNNNPSIEPAWGYRYAHDLPADLARLDGVFVDEHMHVGLKHYEQEDGVIYCAHQELYIKYVSSNFLNSPTTWPAKFKRLVAAKLARDVAPSVATADLNNVEHVYRKRMSETKASDAMQSPPRVIGTGDWYGSRGVNRNRYRGRP